MTGSCLDTVGTGLIPPVPSGVRSRLLANGCALLFRRAVARLAVRVEYPDGTVLGVGACTEPLPRMILRDPDAFFARVGTQGLIGFGESYLAGEWTSPDPTAVLTVLAERLPRLVPAPLQRLRFALLPSPPASDLGTTANARSNIEHHYDLSNELFQLFLDETMTYSAALFEDSAIATWEQLAAAQRRKVDRLLDDAGVRAGSRVLEIGSGWGELCVRAAARGATVHSVTLSTRQLELARIRVAAAGFSESVVLELRDYRDIRGEYDAIVSVEMIEAIGYRYWPVYFDLLDQRLAPGGRVALQAITMPHNRMRASRRTHTWIQKYIFPGGSLPSTRAIEAAAGRTRLRVRERRGLGMHYAETLRLWRERFDSRAPEVAALGFDATFRRLWQFYLAYSEAGFRSRYLDVQQIVLDRPEEHP
ncbi:class I SAM-dependent methyltransferase [Nocardia heshunensis]